MAKPKSFLLIILLMLSLFPFSFSYAIQLIDKAPNNILVYHRFNDSRYPSTNTTIEQFNEQIQYLKENEYRFVTLSELINNDTKEKSISITIDDAYKSFYEFGFPILKKHNISATLFLSTASVGSGDHMNWSQLKDLLEYGIDIQNHTHTHPHLPNLTINEIEKEIMTSQKLIFDNLSIIPDLFAYPYGEANNESALVMKKYFKAAFGQHSGAFSLNDPFYIPRFPINESYSSIDRIKTASTVLPFNKVSIKPSNQTLSTSIEQKRFVLNFFQDPSNITCYISDFNGTIQSDQTIMDDMLLISLERTAVKGRLRFNCTKFDRGTYWFGHQYFIN